MKILIATDIYGINDELRSLFKDLSDHVQFLSPWDGDGCPYETEQEAVTAFHADNGLITYQQKIANAAGNAPTFFIGFSVGASSLWLHSASQHCHADSQAQLYYGSRIRDHLSLIPRCQTSLIFAEHEFSFQPASIAKQLHDTAVKCTIIQGARHGFMNPHSSNFEARLARQEMMRMKEMHSFREN